MPTFSDPLPDADEAYEALRGLAHATRVFDNPADTYPVIGDLLGGARSLRQMDAQRRLARYYGIANMLIFHKLSDLDNVGDAGTAMRALASSLLANAETRIIYRQEPDQLGPTASALGLTGTEQKLLPTLGTGQGLWRIKDRSFVVQHQLHPNELSLFDTTSRMVNKVDGFRGIRSEIQRT